MLDNEPTGAGESDSLPAGQDPATTPAAASPPAKTTRRRRASTAATETAAAALPSAPAEVETPAAEEVAPPRRTRRRAATPPTPAASSAADAPTAAAEAAAAATATAKAAGPAAAVATTGADGAEPDEGAARPAVRTRSRRRPAAAAADPSAAEAAGAEPPASAAAATADEPPGTGKAAVKRSRARRTSQPEPEAQPQVAAAPEAEPQPADGPVLVAPGGRTGGNGAALRPPAVTFVAPVAPPAPEPLDDEPAAAPSRRRRSRAAAAPAPEPEAPAPAADEDEDSEDAEERRRRRRGRRGRGRGRAGEGGEGADDEANGGAEAADADDAADGAGAPAGEAEEAEEEGGSSRRRRRRRRRSAGEAEDATGDDPPNTVVHVREPRAAKERRGEDEVQGVRGSTRLEAKRQRRRDGRDQGRRRPPILSEAEFLARREAVDRVMVVRQRGDRTQIAVLEDDVLVEHYVTKASSASYAGNVYLGRVQNVLPSMEAAFVDIGKARNAVLYAGEVDWDVAGLEGKARSIEHAMKSGDTLVVQVTKDPIGHKGARLTSQISLPGRYLVYVPGGSMTGISRKLPDTERARLKDILRRIVPEDTGVIIRTAAEGASEEELTRDVNRLHAQWEVIREKAAKSSQAPVLLSEEPDLAIRVVRDVFNEDFSKLVVSGDEAAETLEQYVAHVAPDLAPRLSRHTTDTDVFADLRIDEQLMKALDRKVWLPSGGSLVIDRSEAMTVIDVNTGKFTGQGGTLEQTVTRNNLEAAEEVVRQLRLRDIGGIIVIDFIDMVLESNRDLVLRRLTECLGRDRTKHQVAEVTSLGLVQMTRKRVGQGLLEAFSEPCPSCNGRGLLVHTEPLDEPRRRSGPAAAPAANTRAGRRSRRAAAAEETAGPATAEPAAAPAAEVAVAAPAAGAAVAEPAGPPAAAEVGAAADGVPVGPAGADPGLASADAAEPGRGTAGGESVAAAPAAGRARRRTGRIGAAPAAAAVTADGADPAEPAAPASDGDAGTAPAAGAESGSAQAPAFGSVVAAVSAAEPAAAESAAAEPAPRRRRRAASRPPGPPAPVAAESARPAV
jgi:ribonuclease E